MSRPDRHGRRFFRLGPTNASWIPPKPSAHEPPISDVAHCAFLLSKAGPERATGIEPA